MRSLNERRRFAAATDASPLPPAPAPPEDVARVIAAALAEDVGAGDRTTEGLLPAAARCRARLVLEEDGVVCGLEIAGAVFAALDPGVTLEPLVTEGAWLEPAPASLALIEGPARAILTGERTALNLLGRLSGIATLTRRYVEELAGSGVTLLDTRKTTPGLRALERYAVRCGGGTNHRFGLGDAVLLKENHLRLAGGIAGAIARLRDAGVGPIEVEAETLEEVADALAAAAERILLDNMTPAQVRAAVELVDGRALLEASGGIDLLTLRDYASAGIDAISVGALTHSAPALPVSLEVE